MSQVFQQADPILLFRQWFEEAGQKEPSDANAMALATCHDGRPSVRIVLMRGVDAQGFEFYTNYNSHKAQELAKNPFAAICFHWKSLSRQVRAEGKITKLSDDQSDSYFKSRAEDSKLGAWASLQSEPLSSRDELERRVEQYRREFEGQEIPRPPHWGGYKLLAERIEFWQERPHRLHDRELFVRAATGWTAERLYP